MQYSCQYCDLTYLAGSKSSSSRVLQAMDHLIWLHMTLEAKFCFEVWVNTKTRTTLKWPTKNSCSQHRADCDCSVRPQLFDAILLTFHMKPEHEKACAKSGGIGNSWARVQLSCGSFKDDRQDVRCFGGSTVQYLRLITSESNGKSSKWKLSFFRMSILIRYCSCKHKTYPTSQTIYPSAQESEITRKL